MDNLEKVEKIREKTGISYEEAMAALEANNYDVLDALVYLERQGKIREPEVSAYSTGQGQQSQEFARTQQEYEKDCRRKSFENPLTKFFRWCGRILRKSCDTSFEVIRDGKLVVTIPVIVLILGTVMAFWVTLILLVVGMFMGCKYHFGGFESTQIDINDICEKASETCENIKNDFHHGSKEEGQE